MRLCKLEYYEAVIKTQNFLVERENLIQRTNKVIINLSNLYIEIFISYSC